MVARLTSLALTIGLASLVGCSAPPSSKSKAIAQIHPGLEKFRSKKEQLEAPSSTEVRAWFGGNSQDSAEAIRALASLLRSVDPETRKNAAYLLGYLGDETARSPLVGLFGDSSEKVRLAACTALKWIQPGKAGEAALWKLCKLDPSTEVRVVAAEAIGGDDRAVIDAFQLGLVDEDNNIRERCETALERLDRLILPLPEGVYEAVQQQEYDYWKQFGKIEREALSNGTIYFEVLERTGVPGPPGAVCAIGHRRRWCCVKLD